MQTTAELHLPNPLVLVCLWRYLFWRYCLLSRRFAFSVELALIITGCFLFLILLRLAEIVKFQWLRDIPQIVDGW